MLMTIVICNNCHLVLQSAAGKMVHMFASAGTYMRSQTEKKGRTRTFAKFTVTLRGCSLVGSASSAWAGRISYVNTSLSQKLFQTIHHQALCTHIPTHACTRAHSHTCLGRIEKITSVLTNPRQLEACEVAFEPLPARVEHHFFI